MFLFMATFVPVFLVAVMFAEYSSTFSVMVGKLMQE